jgi:tRNA pseudouridine55 synthase
VSGKIRVYAEGRLIGVGEAWAGRACLWPKRLVQLAL